jgi:pentatricopeptide repeat protein
MVFAKLFEQQKAKAKEEKEAPKESPPPSPSKKTQSQQKQPPPKQQQQQQQSGKSKQQKRGNSKPSDSQDNKRGRRSWEEDPHSRQRNPSAAGKKARPSPATLALSAQLKDLSRQKRLDEALALYWKRDKGHENVTRDEHHACIVVDACSRCGAVEEAERIVQDLRQRVDKINVTTQTALLKGYAHSGRMQQAINVFRAMCSESEAWDRPNVRTLNTLLRGCLWTAAVKDAQTGEIVGGVATSEEAWQLFTDKVGAESLDSSSFETSISLLNQALRTREAEQRISEFQARHGMRVKGKASIIGGDQTVLETLAVSYLGLARAYALCARLDDMWTACQRVLSAVKSARALWNAEQSPKNPTREKTKRPGEGGKRAWNSKEGEDEQDARRAASNIAYRTHRLSELETEAKDLLKLRKNTTSLSSKDMAKRVLSRLFYFSGGGTTDLAATSKATKSTDKTIQSSDTMEHFLTSSWLSFGLAELVEEECDAKDLDLARVGAMVGMEDSRIVRDDGLMDFDQIFSSKKKPIHIELGAGFGDWVVRQARHDPSRNYVAVELRADRVAQIFSKATLDGVKPLENVCVVGSECGSFLSDRVKKGSVSTVFANFPEPPTQSFGGNGGELKSIMDGVKGAEPAHMLNSATLAKAASCLKSKGRIVIVTDNRWYARLLCATFVKVAHDYKDVALRSSTPSEMNESGLRLADSFADPKSKAKSAVILYEGQPGEAIGYVKTGKEDGGVSYFDRLWRTGAGSHSERRTRFVIVMNRD